MKFYHRHTGALLFHGQAHELKCADLRDANMQSMDLQGADMQGVDLQGANLRRTDLQGTYLRDTNLRDTDLQDADLRGANLRGTDLQRAHMEGANLQRTILQGANLQGADLRSTVLDPDASPQPIHDQAIISAGLEIVGDRVYGWRTAESQHCGSTAYLPGHCYTAPVFSVCADTSCHPGIYLAGEAWLAQRYPFSRRCRCYCLRSELVHAGDKWRCRRLWVVRDRFPEQADDVGLVEQEPAHISEEVSDQADRLPP